MDRRKFLGQLGTVASVSVLPVTVVGSLLDTEVQPNTIQKEHYPIKGSDICRARWVKVNGYMYWYLPWDVLEQPEDYDNMIKTGTLKKRNEYFNLKLNK